MTHALRTITDVDVVLVVGPMRTGTTLVARSLDSHPDVAYLGFELAEEWSAWTGVPFGAPGADDVVCPALGASDATPERVADARRGLSTLLRRRIERTGERPRTVVLKNPHFWHRLPFVLRVLPHAAIARTTRPLLPTVASLRRLWERALAQHGRVHHLPTDPSRCWDFVPRDQRHRFDPHRTFPDGDIGVLAEFYWRVEGRLDAVALTQRRRFRATIAQPRVVDDFDRSLHGLQRAVGLDPTTLSPPQPLDPERNHEWRELLAPPELEALRPWLAGPSRSTP